VPRFCSATSRETGTVPSKFVAHRRTVQYWLHVSHDSWFAPLLSDFRGQGPTRRLQNTAALYGFTRSNPLPRDLAQQGA
jgi:hypothetical protein